MLSVAVALAAPELTAIEWEEDLWVIVLRQCAKQLSHGAPSDPVVCVT